MLIQAAGSPHDALAVGCRYASCRLRTAWPGCQEDAPTGGADHIRSSLLVVFEDTATASCAGVGSRGPPEDRDAGCRVYAGLSRASQQGGC